VRAALERALAHLRSAIADLRRLHPRTAILMAVCALVVALGPLALSLSRKGDYRASSSITHRVVLADQTREEQVATAMFILGTNVGSREVLRAVADDVPWIDSRNDLSDHVTVSGRWDGRPVIVFTARAPSSGDARTLAATVSRIASKNAELAARSPEELDSALGRQGRVFAAPTPVWAEKERPVDSLLAALPGRPPARVQSGWAAVAGLALAMALILAVVALGPSNTERRREAAV
jgi:hypothetical protein